MNNAPTLQGNAGRPGFFSTRRWGRFAGFGLLAVVLGLGVTSAVRSQTSATPASPLEQARQALAGGRLDEAERLASQLPAPAAAHVKGKVAEGRGQLDAAIDRYREAAAQDPRGDAALDYGLLLLRRGRIAEGKQTLAPLVQRVAGATSPADLNRAGRAARALGQFRLANDLFREATAADPQSAPVNTAWGDLLLEKHNIPEAAKSYQIALKSDPGYALAHLGMARALMEENPPAARAAAAQALKLNPTLWEAALIEAAVTFDSGERAEAAKKAQAILERNPSYLEAYALLAGIAWVEDRRPDYESAVAKALAINPVWGEAYRVAGEYAAGSYRFTDAAELTRKGTTLDPANARAWADLGKHLLRVGDEPEARVALDKAFEQDPFDQITFNLLSLLDTLDDFETIDAAPFVIKLHPNETAVMKDAVLELSKDALAKLSARYGFTPTGPILIEMFPKHDDFAVRNVGLPGMIGALGACFGRVVTLDSPKARPPGSFNWGATLWHELAHVFTLQLSAQRVPRWLTEGISVYEERRARASWGRESEFQFVQALAAKTTFPLATLNSGFTDPRRITLAYQQASVVVEHLVGRFGEDVLPRLMKAYAQGLDDEAAMKQVTGVGLADLQQSYDTFTEARFGSQRRALEPVEGLEEVVENRDVAKLNALAETHPDRFAVQMSLGHARLAAKDFPAARAAFERAATLVPAATGDDGPKAMIAKVAEVAGEPDGRRAALAEAIDEHHTGLEMARELMELSRTSNDQARLKLAAQRVVEVDPFDARAYAVLGRLSMTSGDTAQALAAFRNALQAGAPDVVGARTDLAEALLAAGRRDEAKAQALAALEQAPRFERAQQVLLAVVDDGAAPR